MGLIKVIVAVAANNTIGNDNDLPWHLPTDMKMFKEVTANSIVIMGRKCWESIPEKYRPLPGRTNIVLTRNPDYEAPGAEVSNSMMHSLNKYMNDKRDTFIIGGSEIYKSGFDQADYVLMTRIHEDVEGSVKLTGWNPDSWVIDDVSPLMEENGHSFSFERYKRQV
jgi:dihydrofolate reductase